MPMAVVATDMVTGQLMVTTMLVYHIWVDHNQVHTTKVTMLTDINPMLHGVLVVMEHNLVTEVPEVERESWWFTNTTVN